MSSPEKGKESRINKVFNQLDTDLGSKVAIGPAGGLYGGEAGGLGSFHVPFPIPLEKVQLSFTTLPPGLPRFGATSGGYI